MSEYTDKLKINKCKSTHGRYNDNGNIIIEMDIELNQKKITKDIAIKAENLVDAAPELLEAVEQSYEMIDTLAGLSSWDARSEDEINEVMNRNLKAIKKAKGDDE